LMVEGLAAAGVQVEVATTDDDGAGRFTQPAAGRTAAGVPYHFFPRQTRFYTTSLPLWWWLRRQARQFDLLHVHALFSFASTVAVRAAQRAGVPYLVRPLGTLAPYGLQQHRVLKQISLAWLERRALSRAAALHCTSQAEAAEIHALGIDTRCAIIPLGIRVAARPASVPPHWLARQAPELAGRPMVLFLSRIDNKKGIELLLAAFARLQSRLHRPAALVIAGAGDSVYTNRLRQQAELAGVADSIFWAGHLDGAAKAAALAEARAFVLPSKAENFGIAAVEALAAGVPIVISRDVAIHHEVSAADAGLTCERDVQALAECLRRLLSDDALHARLAANARRLAEQQFSQPLMIQRLLDLYRSVLG
jgi:glycosyltransferase involved in cell wall biosynthesis